jgi:3-hydroxybutyryl-CoA dehydratase
MIKEFFEDCQIGDRVQSPGRTITETDIVLFSAFTGDWLPIHTDAEHAKKSIYGERIAHGLLVLTVGSALLLRLGEFALLPKATIALYAIDKVRFIAPTKIGDTLYTKSEVIQMTRLDHTRGLLTIRGEISNQRDEAVASFRMKALVGRRPVQ